MVKRKCKKTEIGIGINNARGIILGGFTSNWNNLPENFDPGNYTVEMNIPFAYMVEGKYQLSVWIKEQNQRVDDQISSALNFRIIDADINGKKTNIKNYKHLNLTFPTDWTLKK